MYIHIHIYIYIHTFYIYASVCCSACYVAVSVGTFPAVSGKIGFCVLWGARCRESRVRGGRDRDRVEAPLAPHAVRLIQLASQACVIKKRGRSNALIVSNQALQDVLMTNLN